MPPTRRLRSRINCGQSSERFRHFDIYSVTNDHPDIPFNQGLKALSTSATLALSVEFIAISRSQDGRRLSDILQSLKLHVNLSMDVSISWLVMTHVYYYIYADFVRFRRPACAIFPITAVRVAYSSGYAVWLVYEQPCDPVCVNMDICIMPGLSTGTESVVGTIQALSLVRHGWAFFEVQTSRGLIVLCVPKGWADVDYGISMRSRIMGYWRPAWLLQISPEIFTAVFNTLRGGMLSERRSASEDRSSAETIRPRTIGPRGGWAVLLTLDLQVTDAASSRYISWYGPRFAVAGYPPVPVALGRPFQLEVRYLDHRDGTIRYAADTRIRGTVFAIESVSTDSIEFVLCNDGPGHPYCYIIVPHRRPGFVSLPYEVEFACWLLRPYVYCTYWSENNLRPPVEDYPDNDTHTHSPSSSAHAAANHTQVQPTGLVMSGTVTRTSDFYPPSPPAESNAS
ncbi:hypothetical protein K466DRAFT_570752 [Polyporus arcularius HHB13444]|uniref:Uncharacterized protein n=1 Tax=Polyporus arcularius HHB13444 TaxID=1314778 RepID=A0A5C3NMY2_9APHY|nr:hypothetical protein K466DRAFT_570752 [Polyporus arcularius HHB13444]